MSIIFSYPWWFLAFCVLTGGIYASGLYLKNKKNRELPLLWLRSLAFLRFLLVSILCFLLLSPLVKNIYRTIEKPLIVIARDNSMSILVNKDSTYYKSIFPKQLEQFSSKLSEKYNVVTYNFGEQLSENKPYDFTDKQTDIDEVFKEMEVRYSNRNLGALILASDGLYNKGITPLYHSSKIKAPVYTIALGDTSIRKDLLISAVDYNKVVFLGNQFPVDILVNATMLKNKSAILSVISEGKTVFEKKILIGQDRFNLSTSVLLTADKPGTRKVRIQLSNLDEEVTYQNNYQDIYIEVIDSRQKVLILTESPHPDIAAIQQSITSNKNYASEAYLIQDFKKSLKDYSLVVFYQIPSNSVQANNLISEVKGLSIPVLYILGNNTSVNLFNQLGVGLKINGNRNNSDEVQPVLNPDFTLFNLESNTRNMISRFPPLSSPYGNSFEISSSATPFLYRKVGSVSTKSALCIFSINDRQKICVLAGEGIYRWRLTEYSLTKNTLAFDEIINKTVQYLALKEDKSLFRVTVNSQFFENEPVFLDAELYNESYDLINQPDVKLELKSDDGKVYTYTFSKTSNAYKLNAGILPVGEYTYFASVNSNGKMQKKSGMFMVKPIQVEAIQTVADHQLLYMLSDNSGGEMVYPSQLDELLKIITNKEDIVSRSSEKKEMRDLIYYKWIFFLILALMGTEWFARKRQGVY